MEALNWQVETQQQSLFDTQMLNDDEKKILETIEAEEKSVDEIQSVTKFGIDKLLTCLTTMELKGIIKQSEGDRYRKI